MKVNIFLDDMRQTPVGFFRTYTADETIERLQDWNGEVDTLSLDHDLGACTTCMNGRTVEEWMREHDGRQMPHCDHVGTGYKVVLWIEEQMYTNPDFQLPMKIIVHSANPVGRAKMQAGINQILKLNARKHDELWNRGHDCEGC